MPLKNPRQTKSSAAAAKKEDLAQRVKEIKMRQKNWMQQREEHLNSAPTTPQQHTGTDHGHHFRPSTDGKLRSGSHAVPFTITPVASSAQTKERVNNPVSDKVSVKVHSGFSRWLQSRRPDEADTQEVEGKGHGSQESSDSTRPAAKTENKPAAEYFDPSDGNSIAREVSSHKHLPLSPSEFDSLADSIVSRVKKDLGLNEKAGYETKPISSERTFILNSSAEAGGSESKAPAVEGVDSNLDLSSHRCPLCSTLMVQSEHLPMLVVPCGHTMCKLCAGSHNTCRLCGTRVASLTTNIMLQQIIAEFHNRKRNRRRGPGNTTSLSPENNSAHQSQSRQPTVSYSTQLRNYMEREEALQEEVNNARKARDHVVSEVKRAERQLDSIQREESSLLEKQRQLEEKLCMIREHKEEYKGVCERLQEQQKAADERISVAEKTLRSLGDEIDKLKFLAEGQGEVVPEKQTRHGDVTR